MILSAWTLEFRIPKRTVLKRFVSSSCILISTTMQVGHIVQRAVEICQRSSGAARHTVVPRLWFDLFDLLIRWHLALPTGEPLLHGAPLHSHTTAADRSCAGFYSRPDGSCSDIHTTCFSNGCGDAGPPAARGAAAAVAGEGCGGESFSGSADGYLGESISELLVMGRPTSSGELDFGSPRAPSVMLEGVNEYYVELERTVVQEMCFQLPLEDLLQHVVQTHGKGALCGAE